MSGSSCSFEGLALSDTTGTLSLGGDSSEFSVFLNALCDPLMFWIVTNCVVLWIHQQDLEILVGWVFSNPVGVEDSEGSTVTTDTFFSNRLESSSGLNKDTHVNGFTHGSSLGYWLLSSTTSNSDSVYNKSLSCFVTQSSSFFWSSWSWSPMDGVQVSVLPNANPLQVAHRFRLLFAPDFVHIFVCAHISIYLNRMINRYWHDGSIMILW